MPTRRNVIKLTLAGAAALILDPTGLAGSSANAAVTVDAEEFHGFLIVRPASARPRTDPAPGPQTSLVPEAAGPTGATVRTIDIRDEFTRGLKAGPLAGLRFDQKALNISAVNRIVHDSGETFSETVSFQDTRNGRTVVAHAITSVPLPYVLMPIGNIDDGFYEWDRGTFSGRAIIGAAPGTVALAMCLIGGTLLHLSVHADDILGPAKFADTFADYNDILAV